MSNIQDEEPRKTNNNIIPGFEVLTLSWPNHTEDDAEFTAESIATALSRGMDERWFLTHFNLSGFTVGQVYEGRGDHAGSYGFDFGIQAESAGDLAGNHTAVVRETAGGGFMLLVRIEAEQHYGRAIKELFKKAINQKEN